MKHKLKYSLAILSTTALAHGASIIVDNIDPTMGTYSGFATTVIDADTFLFTQTSDFDGGGTDDTLSFTLTRTTYAASTITGSDVTLGNVITGGNTANWFSNYGDRDTIQLEVSGISYTSGEMDGTTAQFTGFQTFGRTNFTNGTGAGTVTIDYLIHTGSTGSTTFTSANAPIDLTSAGNSETVFITAEEGSGGIRLRDLDLEFETVLIPEPSSTALLGLGGLALILRRRK